MVLYEMQEKYWEKKVVWIQSHLKWKRSWRFMQTDNVNNDDIGKNPKRWKQKNIYVYVPIIMVKVNTRNKTNTHTMKNSK